MAQNSGSPLLLFLFLSFLLAAAAGYSSGSHDWEKLVDPKDRDVLLIAKLAVAQYNKQNKANITVTDGVRGETQKVEEFGFTNVRLVISGGPASQSTAGDHYYSFLALVRGEMEVELVSLDEIKA